MNQSKIATNKFTPDFKPMVRIGIFNTLGFFFLDFLIPFVAGTIIDASGTEMGWIFSVRTIGYLSMAAVVGSLVDRFSPKLLVLIGSVGRGIGYFVLYGAIILESLPIMIVGNLMLGLMVGFYWIPLNTLISQKSNPNNRSEAFGVSNAIQGIGVMIGSLIGFGIIGFAVNITPGNSAIIYSALVIYGILNIVGGVLFYAKVDETIRFEGEYVEKGDTGISYRQFLDSLPRVLFMAFMLLLVVMFLGSVNGSISKPFILVYLTKNIESDPILASMAFIPSGIASMLLAPRLGRIVDRFNEKLVISTAAVVGGILTWTLINTSSLIIFSILLVLDTTVATMVGLLVTNILSKISRTHRGKVFGMGTIATDVGAIAGPVFGGFLWDSVSDKAPFIFSIIVEISLIPVYILAISRLNSYFRSNNRKTNDLLE